MIENCVDDIRPHVDRVTPCGLPERGDGGTRV